MINCDNNRLQTYHSSNSHGTDTFSDR